jgi:hypothetical protein
MSFIEQSHSSIHQPEAYRPLQSPGTGRTAYRWRVWSEQRRQGLRSCFATDQRFICKSTQCPWWDECQGLRAEWER